MTILNPKFIGAWNNKSIALGSLGKHKEAMEYSVKPCILYPEDAINYYNDQLKTNPYSTTFLVNKSLALINLGRCEEAIECCEKVLEIDPKDIAALISKGNALGYLGKPEEALSCFKKH